MLGYSAISFRAHDMDTSSRSIVAATDRILYFPPGFLRYEHSVVTVVQVFEICALRTTKYHPG